MQHKIQIIFSSIRLGLRAKPAGKTLVVLLALALALAAPGNPGGAAQAKAPSSDGRATAASGPTNWSNWCDKGDFSSSYSCSPNLGRQGSPDNYFHSSGPDDFVRVWILCSSFPGSLPARTNCPASLRLYYKVKVTYTWKRCEVYGCPPIYITTGHLQASTQTGGPTNTILDTQQADCGEGASGGCVIEISGSFVTTCQDPATIYNQHDRYCGYLLKLLPGMTTSGPWLWGNPGLYYSDIWVSSDSALIDPAPPFAQIQAWASDAETIRRAATQWYVGKENGALTGADAPIWQSGFDATGHPLPASPDDPIAASLGPDGLGQFTYRYVLDNPAHDHSLTPTVWYTWNIEGSAASTSGTLIGWDNSFRVNLPPAIGKYTLDVALDIMANGAPVYSLPVRKHTLYIVFDTPLDSPQSLWSSNLGSAVGSHPRAAWLDLAMQWAGNQTDIRSALMALNDNEYAYAGKPVRDGGLAWKYGDKKPYGFEMIEDGAGKFADCFINSDVWTLLAGSLGIPVEQAVYKPPVGDGDWRFLTQPSRSLDGNAYINTMDSVDGTPKDRWVFLHHAVGRYNDINHSTGEQMTWLYDPTFGLSSSYPSGESGTTALEANVYCRGDQYQFPDPYNPGIPPQSFSANQPCTLIGSAPPGTARLKRLFYEPNNAGGWQMFDYALDSQAPAPTPPELAGVPNGIALAGAPVDHGIDPDNNGLFEWLQVDAPVNVTQAGKYFFDASLISSDGQHAFQMNGLDTERKRSQPLSDAQLSVGAQTVPLYFDGRALREAGINGPYTLDISVYDANGLSDSATFNTQAYTANQFQGLLIENLSLTDQAVNADGIPGDDALRITAHFNMAAAGAAGGRAMLFGGGKRLGLLDLPATSFSAGAQTLDFDFPGENLFAGRVDGPYTVQLDLRDSYFDADGQAYTSAAYSHSQFQAPNAHFTDVTQDAGVDQDNDGRYEELLVSSEVTARVAGAYTLNAALKDSAGQPIASATTTLNLAEDAPQTVGLHFDGLAIGRHGLDGPYQVVMRIQDAAHSALDSQSYQTAPYPVGDFLQPGAHLTGTLADSAVDIDPNNPGAGGDGFNDVLRLAVGLDVAQAGYYRLSASLRDAQDNFITVAQSAETALEPGAQTVDLDFPGAALLFHQVDGPYRVVSLNLEQTGVGLVDHRLDEYQTAAYHATDFGVVFPDTITIRGNTGPGGVTLHLGLFYVVPPQTNFVSAADGSYVVTVPFGWTGTITPSLPGVAFTPASRSYANPTADLADENYILASTPTATITPSPTMTLTATTTSSPTGTLTPTVTLTATQTSTFTPTITASPSPSPTGTMTVTVTATATPTVTRTKTASPAPTGTMTPTMTPSKTPTPTATFAPAKSWNFDSSLEGWVAGHNVDNLAWVSGGYMNGAITGADPYIFSAPGLGVDISNNKIIQIRYANTSSGTGAAFYFITNQDTTWEGINKVKGFTVVANSGYTTYTVDMSKITAWTGTLYRLRFDPAGSANSFWVNAIWIGSN